MPHHRHGLPILILSAALGVGGCGLRTTPSDPGGAAAASGASTESDAPPSAPEAEAPARTAPAPASLPPGPARIAAGLGRSLDEAFELDRPGTVAISAGLPAAGSLRLRLADNHGARDVVADWSVADGVVELKGLRCDGRAVAGTFSAGFERGVLAWRGAAPAEPAAFPALEAARQLLLLHGTVRPGRYESGVETAVSGEPHRIAVDPAGRLRLVSLTDYRERGRVPLRYPAEPGLFNDVAVEVDAGGGAVRAERVTASVDGDDPRGMRIEVGPPR